MTRHQKLECIDKTWLDVDERELEIHQFRRRLQHPQQSLRVPICNALEEAWNALVRGKSDTDLRTIATWDVASVTNLIIYAETLAGANIEMRPDKKREERAVSGDEAQHSSSDQGDSIVKFDKRVFLTRRGCGHTRTKYNRLEDVPIYAPRRRGGMCCTQWKVDGIRNKDEEVTRADRGRRQ